ncbi:MAG: Gfo/Idh/MocA family oxidoreductase [Candidatus Andersenbacteria bacterium]|nr:Gfo/Idh/MocA family oxidoreductase [Candidatus Andersenbacteria bacterium]
MARLALIGFGRWGKKIAKTLGSLPGVDLAYICDPHVTKDSVRTSLPITPPPEIISLPELGKKQGIDGILVATSGSTHFDIALPFIEKGLPVFIEKPLTTSLPQAQALEKAAQKNQSPVFVGHIHLYNPAYRKTKELLPTLGEIRLLWFESMNNGPYRNDMSSLWDWAPHDIIMALDLLGQKPTNVKAWQYSWLRPQTNLADMTVASLEFQTPTKVLLHMGWLSPVKKKKLTIIGSRHTLVFDDTATKKIALYENLGPTVEAGSGHIQSIIPQTPQVSYPEIPAGEPLMEEMKAFVSTVHSRATPNTPISQGVEVVKIIAAIEQAAKST